MKIYTKKGDLGYTQLLGGTKVIKNNVQIDCYGTIDELNAFIGSIYDQKIRNNYKKVLLHIQNKLFNLGSIIAFDNKNQKIKLPEITEKDIMIIEEEIDKMEKDLPVLTSFILPCGHDTVSKCHIARTICRRAERNVVTIIKKQKSHFIYIKFLNRLSDYLFVLARHILHSNNLVEIKWEKNP